MTDASTSSLTIRSRLVDGVISAFSRQVIDRETGQVFTAYLPIRPGQHRQGHAPRLWYWAPGTEQPTAPVTTGCLTFLDVLSSIALAVANHTV